MKFSQETTNKIIHWKNSMAAMPTNKFLSYAKNFLGEIPTPFNKQKLADQISVFFCNEDNRQKILALLGKNDLRIVCFVTIMPHSTFDDIVEFFSNDFDRYELKSHIQNLEERLVLYTAEDNEKSKEVYFVNPQIDLALNGKIGLDTLIKKTEPGASYEKYVNFTPNFIASFISYSILRPDILKADGSLKKKPVKDFVQICGLTEDLVDYASPFYFALNSLADAFMKLGLFSSSESFKPNWTKLEKFAKLSSIEQILYLCASSAITSYSLKTMQTNAQLLFDLVMLMGKNSYTEKSTVRLGTVVSKLTQISPNKISRFDSIMSQVVGGEKNDIKDYSPIENLVETCKSFGIFDSSESNETCEEVLTVADWFLDLNNLHENQKLVSVESDFSVTVMPGLPLHELLPLIKFMDIKRFDVAAVFEINKKTVFNGFNSGMDINSIQSVLEKNCIYPAPQSLIVSLEDWFNSYSGVRLFKGYILRLSEENMAFIEKNVNLSNHILEKLTPQVLVMDFKDDVEALTILSSCGLDYHGSIDQCEKKIVAPSLPILKKNNLSSSINLLDCPEFMDDEFESDDDKCQAILDDLKNQLIKMDLSDEQKQAMLKKINRRLIINPNQLEVPIPYEKDEASAMDNSGKIYLIEKSLQNKNLLEVTLDKGSNAFVCQVEGLNKKEGMVDFIFLDHNNCSSIPVSSIVHLKKHEMEINF